MELIKHEDIPGIGMDSVLSLDAILRGGGGMSEGGEQDHDMSNVGFQPLPVGAEASEEVI